MKKTSLLILIIILGMVPECMGEISTKVCRVDGITPLPPVDSNYPCIYRDIMAGTKLTIIVWSDAVEEWYGGGVLALEEVDMNTVGYLYGRDCDEIECPGSCLPAAGDYAVVYVSYMYPGFELCGGIEPDIGDWFIFDYNALDIGDCNIVFYDYDVNETEPVRTLVFHHVPTRDWIKDNIVNFADFAVLASYWDEENCGDVNNCGGTDLNTDGKVDVNDLVGFTDYWLEETG
jgi:hypothetical protein